MVLGRSREWGKINAVFVVVICVLMFLTQIKQCEVLMFRALLAATTLAM